MSKHIELVVIDNTTGDVAHTDHCDPHHKEAMQVVASVYRIAGRGDCYTMEQGKAHTAELLAGNHLELTSPGGRVTVAAKLTERPKVELK